MDDEKHRYGVNIFKKGFVEPVTLFYKDASRTRQFYGLDAKWPPGRLSVKDKKNITLFTIIEQDNNDPD